MWKKPGRFLSSQTARVLAPGGGCFLSPLPVLLLLLLFTGAIEDAWTSASGCVPGTLHTNTHTEAVGGQLRPSGCRSQSLTLRALVCAPVPGAPNATVLPAVPCSTCIPPAGLRPRSCISTAGSPVGVGEATSEVHHHPQQGGRYMSHSHAPNVRATNQRTIFASVLPASLAALTPLAHALGSRKRALEIPTKDSTTCTLQRRLDLLSMSVSSAGIPSYTKPAEC